MFVHHHICAVCDLVYMTWTAGIVQNSCLNPSIFKSKLFFQIVPKPIAKLTWHKIKSTYLLTWKLLNLPWYYNVELSVTSPSSGILRTHIFWWPNFSLTIFGWVLIEETLWSLFQFVSFHNKIMGLFVFSK